MKKLKQSIFGCWMRIRIWLSLIYYNEYMRALSIGIVMSILAVLYIDWVTTPTEDEVRKIMDRELVSLYKEQDERWANGRHPSYTPEMEKHRCGAKLWGD